MRHLAWLVVAGVLLGASAAFAARPNILVIVGDDMGYADIGVHGCQDIPTPHIDSLAARGVRCTSGYVSGPYCSPTRAGLLTGRYQQRFGHEFNPGPDPAGDIGLPLTETTLADRLKKAGYATGMVGKWHLGNTEKFHPQSRGFDEFFGFLGGARSFFPLAAGKAGNAGARMYRNREVMPEDQPYTTDTFAREATAFIDRHVQHEWFLYLPFNAVHTPMHATEKYLARFADVEPANRRTYCAMMAAMDDAIGAVLAKLDERKLAENTLIFFISDNGGPPVNASSNGSLRGYKAQTWEGGIRVPFLVQWPGKLPAGKVYDQPVIQLDIAPTALAAAGVAAGDAKFDGVDLIPHLSGKASEPPHESLFWRFGDQMAIRHSNYKLVQGRGAEKPLLFDLAADIGEQHDQTAAKPEVAKDLQARYDAWNATLPEPRWGQPNRQLGTFQKKAGPKAGPNKKAGAKKGAAAKTD